MATQCIRVPRSASCFNKPLTLDKGNDNFIGLISGLKQKMVEKAWYELVEKYCIVRAEIITIQEVSSIQPTGYE